MSAATTTKRCGSPAKASASADFVGAHRVLTAAAGMAGQNDVAAAALLELRRVQPNISRAWIASHMPIKEDTDRVHYLLGFSQRRLGLAKINAP
jgi:hypothetical protein